MTVANDTFAILRAGTERGWGVALVCGAGMNCVGVGSRRHARAPPRARRDHRRLGRRLRRGARRASAPRRAARTAAGRRPRSSTAVPGHFGLETPMRGGRGDPSRRPRPPADRRAGAARARRGARGRRGHRHRRAARERGDRLPARDAGAAGAHRRARRRGARRRPLPERRRLAGGADRRAAGRRGPARGASRWSTRRPVVGAALLGLDELGARRPTRARASAAASGDAGGRRTAPVAELRFEGATRVYPGRELRRSTRSTSTSATAS